MKHPFPAALLSLLQPGVGHLYVSRLFRATAFFLLNIVAIFLLFLGFGVDAPKGLFLFVLFLILLRLVAAIDAALLARRTLAETSPWYSRLTLCFLVAILSGFVILPVLEGVQTVKTFKAASGNMEPSLQPGDHFLADLAYFSSNDTKRGQIVVMRSPDSPDTMVIQRIVAVAGDSIQIRNKTLSVNGQPQNEPWAVFRDSRTFPRYAPNDMGKRDNMPPLTVPEGSVFVMGDSRDMSYDSRWFGTIPTSSLVGAPMYVYWSRDRSRIGKELQDQR